MRELYLTLYLHRSVTVNGFYDDHTYNKRFSPIPAKEYCHSRHSWIENVIYFRLNTSKLLQPLKIIFNVIISQPFCQSSTRAVLLEPALREPSEELALRWLFYSLSQLHKNWQKNWIYGNCSTARANSTKNCSANRARSVRTVRRAGFGTVMELFLWFF